MGDTAMNAALDSIYGFCRKSANSPCTAECSALFENVKTDCSGSATWVPTSSAGSRTFSEQSWSLSTVTYTQFSSLLFDETCVALLSAGGPHSDSRRAYIGWW